MTVKLFFDSSLTDNQVSKFIALNKWPDATMHDVAGLNEAAIDAIIAGITATSQDIIYVFANVVAATPAAGEMLDSQVTTLAGKLVGAPGDTTARQIDASNALAHPTKKRRVLLTWESVYPGITRPLIVDILGDFQVTTVAAESTATAGGATTLTKAAAGWTVNAFTGKYLKVTGATGAGQVRKIASNTATVITVDKAWDVNPASGSVFEVVDYITGKYELGDYHAQRYIETYLTDESDSDVIESWRKLIDKDQKISTTGAKTVSQDKVYLENEVIAKGKAIFDYLAL